MAHEGVVTRHSLYITAVPFTDVELPMQISGMLKVNNETSFTVTNFNYDGQARLPSLPSNLSSLSEAQSHVLLPLARFSLPTCQCAGNSQSYCLFQAPAVHWWATKGLTRSQLRCALCLLCPRP